MKRLWLIGALLLLLTVLPSCKKKDESAFQLGKTPAVITLSPETPQGARLVLKTALRDGKLVAESLTVLAPETLAGTVFRFDGGITACFGELEIPLEVNAGVSIGLLAEAFLLGEEDFEKETEGTLRTLTLKKDAGRITLYISGDSSPPERVVIETENAKIDAEITSIEPAA